MIIENNRQKILAIDDEPIIILVSVKVLTAEGFQVDVASNGLVSRPRNSLTKSFDLF
jgi:CheY-like chemotaxis protein